MLKRIRALPGLRSRSNVEIGCYSAACANLVLAAALTVTSPELFRKPPNSLLEGLAGVGGAVFIAYIIGMSDLFRGIPRGPDSEIFLGFLVGLGLCGVAGVALALALIEVSEPLGWLAHLALFWAGVSLFLLAGLLAALPIFSYEAARAKHLNPDE